MKKNLILFLLFFVSINCSFSQSTSFQKTFGTRGTERVNQVIQTLDRGYLLLGQTNSNSTYLVKTDSAGHKSWSRSYSFVYASSVIQTHDGGYLVGSLGSLIKLNPIGVITWMETYQDISLFTSIKETLDGTGYVAIAIGGGLYYNLPILIKTDFNGSLKWSNILSEALSNEGISCAFTQLKSDSCFYIVGDYRYGGSYAVCLLTKVSKNGKGTWNKTITPSNLTTQWYGNNISSKIRETYNGHLLMNVTQGYTDLIEVDSSCAIIKVTGYSTSLQDWDLCRPQTDNSIYVTALVGAGSYNDDILIARSDASGATQWEKIFGAIRNDYPSAIITSKDKGALVVGTSRNFSFGSDDIYIIKTDSAGTATCNYTLNSSITTSLSTATASAISLSFDSIYHPMQQPANFTSTTPSDTTYDACICTPPHADFNIDPFIYQVSDSSTWASTWHWNFGNGQTSNNPDVGNPFYDSPAGNYTVCLKVTNTCGSDSICKHVMYFPEGLHKESAISDFRLFPNPANQQITFISSHILGNITIYNSLGESLLTTTSKSTQQSIDITTLINGIYIVHADGKFIKFIKE